jgi:hypothetical protein
MASVVPLVRYVATGKVSEIQPGDIVATSVLPTSSGTQRTFQFFAS